jgi:pimeloyl-ACP methyl ester carboxylesterase
MSAGQSSRPGRQAAQEKAREPVVQPIVLLGGFASPSVVYTGFRDLLAQMSGQPVCVVPTSTLGWLPSILPGGWALLLAKLQRSVQEALRCSTTGKVTLIGHSAGGLLARLYLAPDPFVGHTYGGLEHVDQLVTLGSPHSNQQRWLHGGLMSRWIERRYPGAFYRDQVRYMSVAGKMIHGNRRGSLLERHAYRFYEGIAGEGDVWGEETCW